MGHRVIGRLREAFGVVGPAVLGLLCSVCVASATPTLAQMYHTAWTIREGAPNNINMIAQSPDGFLWLGTDSGLFRFDGQSFERYRPSSGDPFAVDAILRLHVTADGGLWIGYSRAGASFLKDGHNTYYGPSSGLGRNTTNGIAVDQDNVVWLATGDSLKRLNGSVWKSVGLEMGYPLRTRASTAFVDSLGTLWVGTHDALLYLEKGDHTFHAVPGLTWEVTTIKEGPDGVLWLTSLDAPIRVVDLVSKTLRPSLPFLDVRSLSATVTRDGSLWVTTLDRGILRMPLARQSGAESTDARANAIQHFAKPDGLSSNYSFQVLEDREGSIWIATTSGLDQFRPAAFAVLDLPEGLLAPSVAVTQPGRFFFGAALVDASTGHVISPAPASINFISSTFKESDGAILFGGENLWRMSDEVFTPIELPQNLEIGRRVQSIAEDAAGSVWISMPRNGVYKLSDGRWTKVTVLEAAPDNLCLSIRMDSRARLWFTYARANQVQVLTGNTLTTYGAEQGLDLGVTTVIDEVDGHIIVGGQAGLQVLDGSRFRHLRLADGAPIADVTGMLRAEGGDFWVNQASGIVRILGPDLAAALADPERPMPFRLFDYLDGLEERSSLPSPLPTIHEGPDHLLYFTMRTRVFVMNPTSLPRNTLRPAIAIGSLTADSQEFVNPADAVLPPNTERIKFRYSASSLLVPQRVQFRYRLDNYDNVWQKGDAQRVAVYSKLPPGRYSFHVVASNNDGVWNEEGASVRFEISPSFTQSWYFKLLCVALGSLCLWLIYRARLRQMTVQIRRRLYERLDERMQISRDLHDTFFQSIQGLLLRTNTAASLVNKDSKARAILDDVLEQSDRVMNEGREIMLDLRRGADNTATLGDNLSRVGENCKITHPADFKVAVIGKPRSLHPIAFEEICRFGREAITNAFRHAYAKSIEAEVHYERNWLRLRIRDDGIGIDPAILTRGYKAGHWGLPSMHERAKKLGGHVDLWSRAGAGTEMELNVPAAAAYVDGVRRSWFAWMTRISGKDGDSEPDLR